MIIKATLDEARKQKMQQCQRAGVALELRETLFCKINKTALRLAGSRWINSMLLTRLSAFQTLKIRKWDNS